MCVNGLGTMRSGDLFVGTLKICVNFWATKISHGILIPSPSVILLQKKMLEDFLPRNLGEMKNDEAILEEICFSWVDQPASFQIV